MKNETKDIRRHIIHIQNGTGHTQKKNKQEKRANRLILILFHIKGSYICVMLDIQEKNHSLMVLQSVECPTKRNKTIYFNVFFVIFPKI